MNSSSNGFGLTYPTIWCADIAVVGNPHPDNPGVPSVDIHSAFIDIQNPMSMDVEKLPIISRFVDGLRLISKQDQDGCWRYFFAEDVTYAPTVIVQLHPHGRYIRDRQRDGIVSEIMVARDAEAFLMVNRWSIDERFCKFELFNGSRPNEISDDRSVIVLSNSEIRHLVKVLQNVLNASNFYRFDDPVWRDKLTAVAERNVNATYAQWQLTNDC